MLRVGGAGLGGGVKYISGLGAARVPRVTVGRDGIYPGPIVIETNQTAFLLGARRPVGQGSPCMSAWFN